MTHCTDRIIAKLPTNLCILENSDQCCSSLLPSLETKFWIHACPLHWHTSMTPYRCMLILSQYGTDSVSHYFSLFSYNLQYIPLLITIPHTTREKFLDPCLSQYWHIVRTTLYKALTDWLLESRIHTLFIQQLPVDNIWPKKHRV